MLTEIVDTYSLYPKNLFPEEKSKMKCVVQLHRGLFLVGYLLVCDKAYNEP